MQENRARPATAPASRREPGRVGVLWHTGFCRVLWHTGFRRVPWHHPVPVFWSFHHRRPRFSRPASDEEDSSSIGVTVSQSRA